MQQQTIRCRIATQSEMGRAIAQVKKKVFKSVTKIYHIIDQGKVECTTQSDMTTVCIIENEKRFSQTRDTPPMQECLVDAVGYNGEKEEGQ